MSGNEPNFSKKLLLAIISYWLVPAILIVGMTYIETALIPVYQIVPFWVVLMVTLLLPHIMFFIRRKYLLDKTFFWRIEIAFILGFWLGLLFIMFAIVTGGDIDGKTQLMAPA